MLNKFKIGHYSNIELGTGATVILCESGGVCGVSVRGAAPATRETELLKSEKTVGITHAVVLSGGSAYGLEACSGVMEFLREKNIGVLAGGHLVPIVVGASLFDLDYKSFAYPDKKSGYQACVSAKPKNFSRGLIGVSTGTTASKIAGSKYAVKTQLGLLTYSTDNLQIAIILGVNPLGDIIRNGKIIAGAKDSEGKFISAEKVLFSSKCDFSLTNTTIGCILTNAKLTKVQANILSDVAHDGIAKAIAPSHTLFDGDALFTFSSGEIDYDFNSLVALIPGLVARAIQSSVI